MSRSVAWKAYAFALSLVVPAILASCRNSGRPLHRFLKLHGIYKTATQDEMPGRSVAGLVQHAKENGFDFYVSSTHAELISRGAGDTIVVRYQHQDIGNGECALLGYTAEIPGAFRREDVRAVVEYMEGHSTPRITFSVAYDNAMGAGHPQYCATSGNPIVYRGVTIVPSPSIVVRHLKDKLVIDWGWPGFQMSRDAGSCS